MHRYLTKTVASFKRHGADLDPAGKARLKEIDVALAEVTTKFSENVLDATNAWELVITDESKLAGLPPPPSPPPKPPPNRRAPKAGASPCKAPAISP